jgi:hypothetical protein
MTISANNFGQKIYLLFQILTFILLWYYVNGPCETCSSVRVSMDAHAHAHAHTHTPMWEALL